MDFTTGTTTITARCEVPSAPAPLARTPAEWRPPPDSTPHCLGCTARGRCLPAGMSEKEARCLCGVTVGRRRVRKGQALYREGDRFLFLYAVRFGTLKSAIVLNDGTDQVTAFHLRGDVIGIDGTASGRHPTTAKALEDAEVCALPYSQLADACTYERALHTQMVRMAGAEIVRDQRRRALMGKAHSEQRVAAFLLSLSLRMRERGFSPSEFLLRMTRAEIGSYLGTTLETVSRSLSALARSGFITVRRRQIHLLDPDGLRVELASALS